MNRYFTLIIAICACSVSLSAEMPDFCLKLRAQSGFKTDLGLRNGFGVGLNASERFGPGTLNLELGYQYFPGRQYRELIPTNPFGLNDLTAVDSRKDSLSGLGLRISWQQAFTGNVAWQAGLSLARLKNHHESIATFGTGGTHGAWTLALDKSSTSLSPFAGIRWDFDEIGAVEFNLLLQSLKTATVTPVYNDAAPGSARVTPLLGEKSLHKLQLELGYAFKF